MKTFPVFRRKARPIWAVYDFDTDSGSRYFARVVLGKKEHARCFHHHSTTIEAQECANELLMICTPIPSFPGKACEACGVDPVTFTWKNGKYCRECCLYEIGVDLDEV